MKKNKSFASCILYAVKEKGVIGFGCHLIKKARWYLHKKRFGQVGRHTYIEPPFVFEGEQHIRIGDYVTARQRIRLEAITSHNGSQFCPQIIIGNHVSINYDVHIGAVNKVIIEDGVLIASKVFITDHGHGAVNVESLSIPPQERMLYSKGETRIRKNVWIGEGTAILSGVTIGENSIVGANSVVTGNIPDNCVCAGNPARIIKRFGGTKDNLK